MSYLTKEDIAMLTSVLSRAGVNQIEAHWVNSLIVRLLEIVKPEEEKTKVEPE